MNYIYNMSHRPNTGVLSGRFAGVRMGAGQSAFAPVLRLMQAWLMIIRVGWSRPTLVFNYFPAYPRVIIARYAPLLYSFIIAIITRGYAGK